MDKRIQDEALAWDERLKQDRSAETRAAFQAWLAADPAHRAEYRQFESLDALLAASGARASRPAARPRRALWPAMAAATAAALVLVIALVGSPFESRPGGPSLASPAAAQFTRPQRLADGSLVILADGAAVEPDFRAGRRRVTLRSGSARFLVADRGDAPLEVVTTRMRVRMRAGRVDVDGGASGAVTVLAGAAAVTPDIGKTPESSLQVAAGQRLDAATMTLAVSPPPTRLGMIEADGLAVSDLLAIANTAPAGPRIAAAPGVGERRVSGRFDVGDQRKFAQRLAAALGLRVAETASEIVLQPA